MGTSSVENAGFNATDYVGMDMNCHYCDQEAAFAAESDGLKVGLCEEHFRERLQELAEADGLETLKEQVNVDRAE
ncbi:hypothetical protein OB919_16280 [Halobacteria archaeon AArc-curdl1]|uniref:Uncharacterized protein n=2 Tax=Natronosalvus hydrolyticus TaxID=2979988 RepID=A0AAP3E758_9EURY|nr:hypothetical protein [Halobacteria archaeon AArc-curdl1]